MAQNQILNDYGGRLLTFEESAAPFEVVSNSELRISNQHFKHGSHSAVWQWSKDGAQIAIRREIGYLSKNPNPKETSVSTFVFWLYSPKHIEGSLRFEFLKDGDKVKAYVFFKGRSILFKEQGEVLLLRFANDLEEYGKVDQMPVLEGKRMTIFISPKKAGAPKKEKPAQKDEN